MSVRRSSHPLVFVALAAALAVSGCNKPGGDTNDTVAANSGAPLPRLPATLPMATGAQTTTAYAPSVSALPAARPLRTVRVAHPGDAYAYADDAYAFSHALGDAPPDYGFDYQGTQPWAWQGYDESQTFVEPIEGGYRYYYYRPGSATPYFVRDPDCGYGFDNGSLAVIYGPGGAILPHADYGPRLGYAARYLLRGEALFEASRGNERRAVIAADWAARQNRIAASRDRWAAAEAQQAGWQAYRARVADQQALHWAQEAARRDADAQRFAAWHDDGFRKTPPPRAIPVAWRQAPWAQDQQRYRVADRGPAQPPSPHKADLQRPVVAPQGPTVAAGQGQPPRFVDTRGLATAGNVVKQRAARDAVQVRQQPTAQASEQRQRTAPDAELLARQQQAAAERQQQRIARQAPQVQRRQWASVEHEGQDAPRQADRPLPAVVQVHRGDGASVDGGRLPRQQQAAQPQHDDHRQAELQQREAMQASHQQPAAAHQQPAAAQHVAPQVEHAPAPAHVAPAPRPASAPNAAAAPHPQGGGHGQHRP